MGNFEFYKIRKIQQSSFVKEIGSRPQVHCPWLMESGIRANYI